MPKTTKDGECPPLTKEDLAKGKRFGDLSPSLQERLRARPKRGPQKAPTKVQIAIRLSPDVLDGLRATGDGWQTRVDEVMRAWLRVQPTKPGVRTR